MYLPGGGGALRACLVELHDTSLTRISGRRPALLCAFGNAQVDWSAAVFAYPTPFHSSGGSNASPTGPTPITILRMVPVNLLSYAL